MNRKKIILLTVTVAVLCLLLAGVMMIDSPDKNDVSINSDSTGGTAAKAYEEIGDIYTCDMQSISRISVSLPSESFEFVKLNGEWTCPQLANAPLNTSKIGQLVTRLSSVKYVEIMDEGVTAADCNINESSPKLTFVCSLGQITLAASPSYSDPELSYVSASVSDRIYSIKTETADMLFKPAKDYRNDSLRRIDFDSATDITLANANGTVTLTKAEADTSQAIYNAWRMLLPIEAVANDTNIQNNVITAMNQIVISDYCSDNGDFASYGLADKNKYLKVTAKSGRSQTLYFSDKVNGKYYVCTDDDKSIYSVDASLMPFAEAPAIDFADRHVKLVNKNVLSKITVASADADYTINVSEAKNESSVNGNVLDETEFSRNIFTAVCGLVADDIYTNETGAAVITVTFSYTDSGSDVIEFAPYNDRFYTASENGNTKFIIQKSKLNDMLNSLSEYK